MEEKQLTFRHDEDPTPFLFKEGELPKFEKAKSDFHFALQHFTTLYNSEEGIKTGFKNTLCSLFESYVKTMIDTLDYSGVLAKENEERYSEIRQLNQMNRELRKQLGEKVSNEDVRESIKNMTHVIKKWWNTEGLGHTSEVSFYEYGIKVKFSCHVDANYYAEKDDRMCDKERMAEFTYDGFSFDEDKWLIVNDQNYQMITELIKRRFPSAKICHTNTTSWRENHSYRDIEISITSFDDI